MGDLLGAINADLLERGLRQQSDIAAFVKAEVGWKISQQMVSNIQNRKIKNPEASVHVMWTLVALGRGPDGSKRTFGDAPSIVRDTPKLDSFRLTEIERRDIGHRIAERFRHHGITYADGAKLLGVSVDDVVHLMLFGTQNVAVLKHVLDALPKIDGRPESMDYLIWGPGRFVGPLAGPHGGAIEAARARTKPAKSK